MHDYMESIVRPRLNDYHGILLLQDKVDFAIPFLDEDIPLYVDSFLLWKSPSQMDNGMHDSIMQKFNCLGYFLMMLSLRNSLYDELYQIKDSETDENKTRRGY